jgi:hypothetical protein
MTLKTYQYQAVVIEDRGHLTDPEFLHALNEQGATFGVVACPNCGGPHGFANGWKHKEEQAMGATRLAVLLEREVQFECELLSQAQGRAEAEHKLSSSKAGSTSVAA